MYARSRASRLVALQLLVILPAVLSARLAIDIHTMIERAPHVESDYESQCANAHDHRLCVLIYHIVWSPAPLTPRVSLPTSLPGLESSPDDLDVIGDETNAQFARAPPSHVRS